MKTSQCLAMGAFALALSACGSDDGNGTPTTTGGAPGAGGGASGGASGGAVGSGGATSGGATSSGGATGSGGTTSTGGATASGGSAGSGGSPGGTGGTGGVTGTQAGCSATTAAARKTTASVVSDKVIDYALDGAPAAKHYDVLLLMFNASSRNAATPDEGVVAGFYTPRQLGDVFFNDPDGVHAYINEVSHGGVTLSGRVVGWLDLPPTTAPTDDFRINVDAYAQRAVSYATIGNYDIVYIVGLTDGDDVMQIGWQLQNSISTTQGRVTVGIDYMINSAFFRQAGGSQAYSTILPSRSWAHELLHTLGVAGHDISLDCGQTTYGPSCASIVAYGNPFSSMGESALGNHPSVYMKSVLGFIEPSQLVSVTASGSHTLCANASNDAKPKGLTIPLKEPISIAVGSAGTSATFDRLLIEHRRPMGFDRYLERLGTDWLDRFKNDGPVSANGVLVSLGYADAETDSTLLLDTHPTSSFTSAGIVMSGNVGRMSDATLLVGETFTIDSQGITIKVKETTSDGGVVVEVTR
jgi:hypothetical protein